MVTRKRERSKKRKFPAVTALVKVIDLEIKPVLAQHTTDIARHNAHDIKQTTTTNALERRMGKMEQAQGALEQNHADMKTTFGRTLTDLLRKLDTQQAKQDTSDAVLLRIAAKVGA